MLNKLVTGTILLNYSQAHFHVGRCPKVSQDWQTSHPGEKLDTQRIQGLWGNMWESEHRNIYEECLTMKLSEVDNDPTKLRMYQGVSWNADKPPTILYDDHTVLLFKNPEDSSVAAITTSEDLHAKATDPAHFDSLHGDHLSEA